MKVHSEHGSLASGLLVVEDLTEWADEIQLIPHSRAAVIAEAREALRAVLSAEQVYFQTSNQTYLDFADTAEAREKLGLELSGPGVRWLFSVTDASMTGFVTHALGRDDTLAQGILVTMRYVRGEPPAWTVEHLRRGRS